MRRRLMQYDELPPIYRRVAWLEGKGAQYIDTGINARSGLRAKYSVILTSTKGTIQICAARWSKAGSSPYIYFPFIVDKTWAFGYNNSVSVISGIALSVNTQYDIDAIMDKDEINISFNGVNCYSSVPSVAVESTRPLFLFAANGINESTRRYAYAKILTFSMTDYATDKLLANYIPCVRKSDSKPGMYDTVSRTFKTNAGSGEFGVPV